MLKRHEIEKIVPLTATIFSLNIFAKYYNPSVFYLLSLSVTLAGCVIWWLGVKTLGDAFSTLPKAKKLVKEGIYSKIRHPIYVGFSLILVGWCYIINSTTYYIAAFTLILILALRAYLEEKRLTEKFGEKYREYKKETWL